MKKHFHYILTSLLVLFLYGCSSSTLNNADPETLYKENASIDFFVYSDIAYVNAKDMGYEFEINQKVGTINRSGITKNFEDFDATILEVGTEIYSDLKQKDILLVWIDGQWVPYHAYLEG